MFYHREPPLKSSENQTQKTRSELAIAEEAGKGGGESAEEKARRREEKKGEKERRQGKQLADIGVHCAPKFVGASMTGGILRTKKQATMNQDERRTATDN